MKGLASLIVALLTTQACASSLGHLETRHDFTELAQRQTTSKSAVTWDEKSFLVNGERIMLWSGEFHPWRIPVPTLWLDVLQKIKGMGYNTVSFYVNWALLEGKRGDYRDEGVFDLEPFLEAAKEAGLYVIARPGPYINAEVSGGGFPGWLTRLRATLRTTSPEYLDATENYMARICRTISKYQITNGGPIVLFQPENEWTNSADPYMPYPLGEYMQFVMDQATDAGIDIPFISNDAQILGHNRPGTGVGAVDVYGYDTYPMGFGCANPNTWTSGLQYDLWRQHLKWSPDTPHSILEFQGGVLDLWYGTGYDMCAAKTGDQFARVFIKNNAAQGVKLQNFYMTYGGTNWANIGDPALYTSYDYGAAIAEDRTITREKYAELKLQATFLTRSPEYLTAMPQNSTTSGEFSSNTDITVAQVKNTEEDAADFYVVRQSNYRSTTIAQYTLKLPTEQGDLTIPQGSSEKLSLMGRDSKVVVTNYGTISPKILYSTSDIFTYGTFGKKKVLILYAGEGEFNEFSIAGESDGVEKGQNADEVTVKALKASSSAKSSASYITIGWKTPEDRAVLQVGDVTVLMLNRNSAYNYWVQDVEGRDLPIIVNGPHLVRKASLAGGTLSISADFNQTTTVEIIGANGVNNLRINGQKVTTENVKGVGIKTKFTYNNPSVKLPDLNKLDWKSIDTLPEIQSDYDDSKWTKAENPWSNNTLKPFWAPVSLYASDYGYNTGMLLYRGRFNASGDETTLALKTAGGYAFSASLYLGDQFLGSHTANISTDNNPQMFNLTQDFVTGKEYTFTVIVGNQGLDHSWIARDEIKAPRGVIGWNLLTKRGTSTKLDWKLTGNLGGEDYEDKSRGPLNEGGLFVERNGFHLPGAPTLGWSSKSPSEGLSKSGIEYYAAKFNLDLPSESWDIPLSVTFSNDTASNGQYRGQLYINGWQYGRFGHQGPQYDFYVPEGILNYNGENTIGISLWALTDEGAKIKSIKLRANTPVYTSRQPVELTKGSEYSKRARAY